VHELEQTISGLWGNKIDPLQAENESLRIKLEWARKRVQKLADAVYKARNVGSGHGDIARVMCDVLRKGLEV
jgi:hypothetical protein